MYYPGKNGRFRFDPVSRGLLLTASSSCRRALIPQVEEVLLSLLFRLDLAILRR
jgi:hypothetical protein